MRNSAPIPCHACDGVGYPHGDRPCADCDGSGIVEAVPQDERCMHPSGCDRRATVFVERPTHWHDDYFCAEHAS